MKKLMEKIYRKFLSIIKRPKSTASIGDDVNGLWMIE
jgi:hypothetical protein